VSSIFFDMLISLLVALLMPMQSGGARNALQADVDRLVRAAEKLDGTWSSQPPPPIPEVAVVARHGSLVVPLLLRLLSDDPNAERDRRRWRVQQQVSLALCRIYSESEHCGRTYCDGDPPERIGRVKDGWLRVIASDTELRSASAAELLDRFRKEQVFWRQFEIGEALADSGNRGAIEELDGLLAHEDRHLRGNVAYVLGRLGDPRGFDTIAKILTDRSARPEGQGVPGGNWTERAQIRSDRSYAASLLGNLKDPRGVDLLVPLLNDEDCAYVVPWSLGQLGDKRSIPSLIKQTDLDDPSLRVLTIGALEQLNAREALPRLRELLKDTRKSNFGNQVTVADAARRASAVISQMR
jgi:hypothetical protein